MSLPGMIVRLGEPVTMEAGTVVLVTWSGLGPVVVRWFVLWSWGRWFLINVFIFYNNVWALGVFILVLEERIISNRMKLYQFFSQALPRK